jgi:two-component system, response regulator YesN
MDLRIERALDFMEAHCGRHLTLQLAACEVGLSTSRFEHPLKAETGSTFQQSLRSLRLNTAKRLLLDPRLRVKEIAAQCGYAHTSNLTREFKRQLGITPSGFREQQTGLTNSTPRKRNGVDAAGVAD